MSATPKAPGPEEIRDYLLRRLSETARTRFEEAYFADDGLFDRIEAEEDRLVSDYVLGRLGSEEKALFEASLLRTPYYQERVDTTSRLHRRLVMGPGGIPSRREARADRMVPPRPRRLADLPLFPPGAGKAIAIVVLVVLLAAALLSAVQLKRDVDLLKAAAARQERAPAADPSALATLRLLAVPLPGPGGPPVLRVESIREGSLLVVPRSLLGGQAEVRLLLADSQGRTLWESAPAKAPRSPADGDLPVALPPGLPPKGSTFLRLEAGGSTSLLAVVEAP